MTAAAFKHMPRGSSITARLSRYSIPITECGCWIWLGSLDGGGYGKIRISGKMIKTHRASWMVYRGQIPRGLKVLHQCDVGACINPDHLFLGTQTDNMRDMIAKGRKNNLYGEKNPNAKLTAADVFVIRQSNETLHALARRFGVGKSMIGYIRSGQNWKTP